MEVVMRLQGHQNMRRQKHQLWSWVIILHLTSCPQSLSLFSLWKEFKICRTSTNAYLWKNTVTVEADPHLCRITGLVTASPNVMLLLCLGLPFFRIFRNTQWPTSLPHHWSCLPPSPQSRRCSARHTQCHVYKPPAGHNRQIFSQHILKFPSSWQNTSFPLAATLRLPIGVSKK